MLVVRWLLVICHTFIVTGFTITYFGILTDCNLSWQLCVIPLIQSGGTYFCASSRTSLSFKGFMPSWPWYSLLSGSGTEKIVPFFLKWMHLAAVKMKTCCISVHVYCISYVYIWKWWILPPLGTFLLRLVFLSCWSTTRKVLEINC